MSEELKQKNLTENGKLFCEFEIYNIGATTLNGLSKYNIINKDFDKRYNNYKPDFLVVDRTNKDNINVSVVAEWKPEIKNEKNFKSTIQQCNTVAQVISAKLCFVTDGKKYLWFNPNQAEAKNNYIDKLGVKRSYKIIKNSDSSECKSEFYYSNNEDLNKTEDLDRDQNETYYNLKNMLSTINENNSTIKQPDTIDPSKLARSIWQDIWFVTKATPEKCLYTFLEIFLFKYLSDLKILDVDDEGVQISFDHIYSLGPKKAFKSYSKYVKNFMSSKFPKSDEDSTGIMSGSLLQVSVNDHSIIFYNILTKFRDFGKLENIDSEFKSKVFEEFTKRSISTVKKDWGQFLTPRNVIDSIIEISGIENLDDGSKICDPACGVGGFILEPMRTTSEGVKSFFNINKGKLIPKHNFIGFDKGFEKEQKLTIVLAKANMLMFLSDLLKVNPSLTHQFSDVFNNTFKLITNSVLGTLNITKNDQYDLILSNPPYSVSGSGVLTKLINEEGRLKEFYQINGTGPEEKFLEWIINSIKPNRKAFVIIPDGILLRQHSDKLRKFIKDQCFIDGIISLPINTFYTTPKKTYILAVTKKKGANNNHRSIINQQDPVFTYIASDIGETLDVNRFPTEKNDLVEMSNLFNQFKNSKRKFSSHSKRCKIFSIDDFDPNTHWAIDRWWSEKERIDLGIIEETRFIDIEEFKDVLAGTQKDIEDLIKELDEIQNN